MPTAADRTVYHYNRLKTETNSNSAIITYYKHQENVTRLISNVSVKKVVFSTRGYLSCI